MASKKVNKVFNSGKEVPKYLEGSFYGMQLDSEQEQFRDAIWSSEKKIIFCNAKAGSGKTFIALGVANLLCQYGLYEGITYIVSPTQEQVQGYLPGGREEKDSVYMQPLYDALVTLGVNPNTSIVSEDNIQAIKNGDAFIECMTHTYLRGVNFSNRVIIVDEAANFYLDSLKKVLTRVHDSCKLIVIGHTGQCDIYKHSERSGFAPYLEYFRSLNDSRVAICELHTNHRGWISTMADSIDDYYDSLDDGWEDYK